MDKPKLGYFDFDNYNRANGNLGNSQARGQAYASDGARDGTLQITSNRVTWGTGGTSGLMVIPPVANGEWEADLTLGDSYPEMVFRHVDGNNFLLIGLVSTGMECWKRLAGTYTKIGEKTGLTLSGTYRVKAKAILSAISFYLDSVWQFAVTETANQIGTGAGPRLRATNQFFDNFLVRPA